MVLPRRSRQMSIKALEDMTINPRQRDGMVSLWCPQVFGKHADVTAQDRFSIESNSRKPSSIKSAAQYLSRPGIISLGGGLPSSVYFPFESLSLKVPAVGKFSEEETRESGVTLTAGKYDLQEGTSSYDISTAFNYSQGSGSAQLLRWCMEHTEIMHSPPYADWSCNLTIGSTSGLDMLLRIFYRPGVIMLTEVYTFSTAAEAARAIGYRVEGVDMDEEGLLPEALDMHLTNWDASAHGGCPKPFLLYTVPSGHNPTGATQSFERRKQIYAIAQKHNLMILEDEPYYYLQMQPYSGQNAPDVPPPATHADFIKSLVPSLLSMDVDGRVIRIDSFSKVLAPGTRCGWITAPEQVISRFKMYSDTSTQGVGGVSQLALFKLLDEHWGHGGYLDWLLHIRLAYSKRRDVLLGACEQHLPRDIVRWVPPAAGMFHWLEVDWKKHPLADKLGVLELEDRIYLRSVEEGTLVIKGSWFMAEPSPTGGSKLFFRTTFAAAPAEKMDEAMRRFGQALRLEFGLEKGKENGVTNGDH